MKRLLIVFYLICACSGCSTLGSALFPSPEQRAARLKAQEEAMNPLHQFHASYDHVFRSAEMALAGLGFVIHHTDMNTGLIAVSLEKELPLDTHRWLELWGVFAYDSSIKDAHLMTVQVMSVFLDKIDDQTTKVKIIPSKQEYIEKLNGESRRRPMSWDEGVSCKAIFDALGAELN
ncbi:MAG: hypothetical protein WCI27_03695 [Candidatus Omnitrophota bacterium]